MADVIPANCEAARSTLVAILLNPPMTTSGVRTTQAVDRARSILGYDDVQIVNLFQVATPTVAELNATVTHPCLAARRQLGQALKAADDILGAWGVSGLAGKAREARDLQLKWLIRQTTAMGLHHVWMVGGEPRHPSRWHQYVSDKYGRTSGGSPAARLNEALVAVPLASAVSPRVDGIVARVTRPAS